MLRVKQFDGHKLEHELNEWLEKNQDKEIVDIKYSVASFSESKSYDSEYFGCALVVYKI